MSAGTVSGGIVSAKWLVSRRFDLGMVLTPAAAALVSLLLLGTGPEIPLWAFLLLIVAFDVAHVWATIYVTYLDPEVWRRRRLLLIGTPLVALFAAFRLHQHSPTLYWTILAYVAIYHFIKQLWGMVALYKARAGERSTFDYYLDRWTLWVGALGPVALWHASPSRQFDWFNAGESFIAPIDPALAPDIVFIMAGFALVYVGRQVQQRARFNVGKNLWMAASWVSWSVGIGFSDHPLVSAAFLNLFHGIPFIGLVWHRCSHRADDSPCEPPGEPAADSPDDPAGRPWFSRRWFWFYAPILILAVAEESLWDALVWKEYLPSIIGPSIGGELSEIALSAAVAVLSVPQIVHYYLDAWIWRLDGSSPDLESAFSLGGKR